VSGPGEPTGGFVFACQLQSKVIVRSNNTDYPAADDRPAYRHEDLMVIHADEDQNLLAEYYDGEGHVIHYSGEVRGAGFRLGYRLEKDRSLTGTFEIASTAQPETFMLYLAWSAIPVPVEDKRTE
jgi:hypothetical protein